MSTLSDELTLLVRCEKGLRKYKKLLSAMCKNQKGNGNCYLCPLFRGGCCKKIILETSEIDHLLSDLDREEATR